MYRSLLESRSLWLHLAGKDLQSRFRGASLGLVWLFVNLIFTFTATAFIWSTLFKLNFLNFLIYIGCGFSVWALITSITIGGSTSILTAISMFLNSTTKLVIAPARITMNAIYIYLISMAIPLAVAIATRSTSALNVILSTLGSVLVIICLFHFSVILAYLGVKYKDLTQALTVLFQFAWVVTPIIYKTSMLTEHHLGTLLDLNPLAWFVSVIRDPLLTRHFDLSIKLLYVFLLILINATIVRIINRKEGRDFLLYA